MSDIICLFCIDKNNVFASSYNYDLNKKSGELINEIKLEDVKAIRVNKTIEKINNFMRLTNFSLSQSAGIESLWDERIPQILKERELTMDIHCDEYAKMQNISAKKNIQNKIPVQQYRVSSSNRPPSPVPVLKPLKQENIVSKHVNKSKNTPSNPDAIRREQFRQMIKTGDPDAIKKYMDMVKNCPKQQKSKQEKRNFPQRKVSEREGR